MSRGRSSACCVRSVLRSVTLTVKTEPLPFSDVTEILPFIMPTIFLLIAMPSPDPP